MRLVSVALLTLVACRTSPVVPTTSPVVGATTSEPTTPIGGAAAAPTTAPATPVAASPSCLDPRRDAVTRMQLAPDTKFDDNQTIDFNHDGQPDVIVQIDGGREEMHLLYVMDRGCGQFVGAIRAFMLDCAYSATPPAMCDLSVDTWLMHGDRKRCRWTFSGGRYVELSDCEDIMGPRKSKRP